MSATVYVIRGRSVDGPVYWDGMDNWAGSVGDAHPMMTVAEAQAQMDRLVDRFTKRIMADEAVGQIGWQALTRAILEGVRELDRQLLMEEGEG